MEDDDELYEPDEVSPQDFGDEGVHQNGTSGDDEVKMELEEGEEEGDEDEDEEDDSESDIEFITEKKDGDRDDVSGKPQFEQPRSTPIRLSEPTPKADALTLKKETSGPASAPLKPGSEYPAIHASTIDVNADPVYGSTGKTISQLDLDADFPGDNDKQWRRPGSDITDYFNYGFDEFTWASYCLKQQSLRKDVTDQKKEMEEMQNFFGGAGGMPGMPPLPPMPGAPAAAPAGPGGMGMSGMPELTPDLMGGMMSAMAMSGIDPSSMPPDEFMKYAQQYMQAMNQGGGQQQQQQQQQGYGAPTGPAQHQQQGGYGGFEQGQGQPQGRGGRGRGGRRWQ